VNEEGKENEAEQKQKIEKKKGTYGDKILSRV
jgi:hypothetical protein